ncbi:phosphoglycerate-specific signal transduction histidine kinase [Nocardioides cavernae]|uniref:Phosphoglycerate-specific signal transduction histidine kinase n=1 Tax=Nocardioides cavernae TaxID=1921566 RepID=A0A7Y9H1W0_9ACTN|nr:hypothetical protein [Nocardioides cavernae]NYE36425.1 phosphoglycerate-specific signal transduction histidine kinase [Nocardioides cavernae]
MDAERSGGFDRIADLPDDDSREKEVYARYGLAMFHAHAFEHGMITLITASVTAQHAQAQTRDGANAFNELVDELYRRTAGQLLARLRENPGLTTPLDNLLKDALGVRNRLAHGWFRKNGLGFGSADGMQAMVDDLDRATEIFQAASVQAYGLAGQVFLSLGLGEHDIERVRDRLARLANAAAPE